MECQADMKLAVSLQSKQSTSGPAQEQKAFGRALGWHTAPFMGLQSCFKIVPTTAKCYPASGGNYLCYKYVYLCY